MAAGSRSAPGARSISNLSLPPAPSPHLLPPPSLASRTEAAEPGSSVRAPNGGCLPPCRAARGVAASSVTWPRVPCRQARAGLSPAAGAPPPAWRLDVTADDGALIKLRACVLTCSPHGCSSGWREVREADAWMDPGVVRAGGAG